MLLVLTELVFCVLPFTTQAEKSRYRMSSSKFTAVNVRSCSPFQIHYCLGDKSLSSILTEFSFSLFILNDPIHEFVLSTAPSFL